MAAPCIHVIVDRGWSEELARVAGSLGMTLRCTAWEGAADADAPTRRRWLQATIDAVSAMPGPGPGPGAGVSQVVIAMGCGDGATLGLHARHVPLSLPRRHAEVSAFLATAGQLDATTAAPPPADEPVTADETDAFLRQWRLFYERVGDLPLHTGQDRLAAARARDLAQRHGWTLPPRPARDAAWRSLLTAQHTSDDVLYLPPHHATVQGDDGRLRAMPVWKLDADDAAGIDQVVAVGSDDDSAGAAGLGLGIDAGGTYTDVVLYDFAAGAIVRKAKALTTKWDHTIGIGAALDQLDPAQLAQVELVSISTTLATNAVVEGRGQKVGLLIMPPYGLFADDDITHRPIAVVAGQMEIDGSVRSPINPDEIGRVARHMVRHEGVGAFAVTGYASHVNPEHEMQIRAILQRETGLSVTCGHDVSEQLNYRVRAQTAALNGRIIPILVAFLRQAATGLRARGIAAPMMVVRSDGSLMSVESACERPIETILSGPAASVAGARRLAREPSAFVVDIGGTTTDTALVLQGAVRTSKQGAKVGGWQTHVQALDMRTCGLGGDSHLTALPGGLQIGPRRVAPVAWLAAQGADLQPAFAWIEQHLDRFAVIPELMDLYTLNRRAKCVGLAPREQRIVDALARRPHCGHELAAGVLEHWWESLDLDRLEASHLVQRSGLTMTDLLHVTGRFTRWHTDAAARMLQFMARGMDLSPQRLIDIAMDQFVRRLALEILKKQLDEQVAADAIDSHPLCRTLIDNWLDGGSAHYRVQVQLKHPVIGIGAPVEHFLPQAAALLGTRAIVPADADVANALGAITSSVEIHRQVEICPDMQGRYGVYGMPQAPTFAELHEARAAAMAYLQRYVRDAALAAGTRGSRIQFTIHDSVAPLADGGQVFIAQTIAAHLTGRPDLGAVLSEKDGD